MVNNYTKENDLSDLFIKNSNDNSILSTFININGKIITGETIMLEMLNERLC